MQGKRHDLPDDGSQMFTPGEYGRYLGRWMCIPPGTDMLGNLSKHTVTEHEDGTITVSPSILISRGGSREWHGYLERGVWRQV